ncbi:hypothetical protein L486_08309 [Kwoniella mangroviensis CBS 10435]|uniref:Xylanolytic transcriptional activator regulatory domain-containing protein n=1 Tax=Kwoniella mangroviensis CBS 10435 TaxID=1331196 RepID=A0A1B9IEZ5_9TREE|nr:hypothetical protein L486_08309 [Kwoniella mangroviensis CBS 10435]
MTDLNVDGILSSSPQPIVQDLNSDTEMSDQGKKRKRLSLPVPPTSVSPSGSINKGKQRAVTIGPIRDSPEQDSSASAENNKKAKGKLSTSVLAGFTRKESKFEMMPNQVDWLRRRCEPSPLVPPDHPDAARLPCARCRRFAIDCVRVKAVRRKGPAPVHGSGLTEPDTARRSSAFSDLKSTDFERKLSISYVRVSQKRADNRRSGFPTGLQMHSPLIPINSLPEGIDQVVSGPIIDNVLNLFFDYVYPLTPCLHRPTFVTDLTARRDKTDPIFFALALTVIASTLVQVPRNLVNLDKKEVEDLARKCIKVARAKMAHMWDEPIPITLYADCRDSEGIVHLFLGNNTAHVVVTAQANQMALALRLNEESSYEGLDVVECEMRRRMYWLLFQADKSTACLVTRTICLPLEDAHNLLLPAEVDDEMITCDGILPQPPETTPLITGFNVNTNLFRILNDAILIQRRKSPRLMEEILADLQKLQVLRHRTIQTYLTVPDPLKLRKAYDSRSASPAVGWESKLLARFVDFFSNTPSDRAHALNSYLVMQGNILVTQHVLRLVLLQTRQALLAQLALFTPMLPSPMGPEESAENIACELLDGLNSLPVECVATNGPSLVQKVRFVGIHLMDASSDPTGPQSHSQKLLMQFLSVLSVIEGMYTFGRDISAE